MAYKFSKGNRGLGDITFEDDADTGIDFDQDTIDFQTSGSSVLKISGSDIYVNDGSNIRLGTDSYIYFDGYDTSNDCYITQNPNNSITIDGNNDVWLLADEQIYFNQNATQKVIFDFTNDVAKFNMPISASEPITASAMEIDQDLSVNGAVYHQDFLIAELSIPGLDLQTDTNAYTFNCPYDLEVEGLQLYLDQHTTSGNVTVTVNGAGTDMITLSLTGTATATETSTVTSGSLNAADRIRFAITATPANAQGLRANLQFRRTPE